MRRYATQIETKSHMNGLFLTDLFIYIHDPPLQRSHLILEDCLFGLQSADLCTEPGKLGLLLDQLTHHLFARFLDL